MAKNMQAYMDQRKAKSASALADGLPDDPVNKALDREFDAQFNLATHAEDVVLVSIIKLRPYSRHPFKMYNSEKLNALAESITRDGLQQPIIVRKLDGKPGWEVLAGHNRVEAMKQLGKQDIPAIVRVLNDEQAALVVVETNLKQREKLLPSEKAFAYKLQMEALQGGDNPIIKRGRKASDVNDSSNVVQFEPHLPSRDTAAEQRDVSCSEIQRYIRLAHLLPDLLDKLDTGEVPVMAGYELSFLDTDAQDGVCQFTRLCSEKLKLTLKHAGAIRAAFEAGQPITVDTIPAILQKPKKKPGPVTYRFSLKDLKKQYAIPDGFDLTAFVYEKLDEVYAK